MAVRCLKVELLTNSRRSFKTATNGYQEPRVMANQSQQWNRAVTSAEKIVGYPTSFFNLRLLLSDEIANVALQMKKVDKSNHPFLKNAKNIIDEKNNVPSWGLIVLLLSKAVSRITKDTKEDNAAGIQHRQRVLAEVTEMIRTANLVHRGLVNIRSDKSPEGNELNNDSNFGNKIALLSGDYLLAKVYSKLAALKNQDLVESMATAIKEMSEAESLGRRDQQNHQLPAVPGEDRTGYAVREWTLLNVLSAGSLLGKSCKGTLSLADHDAEMQNKAYEFGNHLALALQASLDLKPFTTKNTGSSFNLCSAPVMFHIEHDPSILTQIDKGLESVHNVNYAKVYEMVMQGPGVDLSKQLHKEHSQKAMECLGAFQKSDARTALSNIIEAMIDF